MVKNFGTEDYRGIEISKLNFLIIFLILCISISSCLITYSFFRPDFNKKQCEAIRENYGKITIGMNREEVTLLLNSRVRNRVYPYSGVIFPEQWAQWEVWLLCKDLNSCIKAVSGKEQCYEWLMVAFDIKTGKVVKIFSDDPERIGFV